MATTSSLVDRVRLELGDVGKTFVTRFVADGTTNRFKLHYAPLDHKQVAVYAGTTNISDTSYVEESTGVLVTADVLEDMTEVTVSGTYYRYFTGAELETIVTDAITQHSAGHTDSLGRKMNVSTLPFIEEYPVAIYATTIALYTLATDSAFDIDIQAPDGVTIPRAERFRQLMEMVQTRQTQYRELCVQLGVGLYKIDVFSLRRISKATGRLIPVYKPQEVDDRSFPQRVADQHSTYGDKPVEWPTESEEITAYQGRSWSYSIDFEGDYTDYLFVAKLLSQRGSVLAVQDVTLEVTDHENNKYTAVMSLTKDQTLRLAERTYWSLSVISPSNEKTEIKGGNFFTVRSSTVVL